MKSTLLIPILLSLGACAVARVPPHEAPSRFGVVHAAEPATALEHARLLDDVGPFVVRALPGLRVEPVDLRIVARVSDHFHASPHSEYAGAVIESGSAKWIEMRSDLEPASRRGVLAHELVHRWLGPAWVTLPPAIEDGLCDVIGDAIRDDGTPRERMMSFLACWITLNGELTVDRHAAPVDPRSEPFTVTFRGKGDRLTPSEIADAMGRDLDGYHSLDPQRFAVITVLSTRLLSRLSVDQIFDMCGDAEAEGLARVPAQRIFEAAGIDPRDVDDWNELLLETYGLEERRALREELEVPWIAGFDDGGSGLVFEQHLQATVEF
jgi:hypothetical protein